MYLATYAYHFWLRNFHNNTRTLQVLLPVNLIRVVWYSSIETNSIKIPLHTCFDGWDNASNPQVMVLLTKNWNRNVQPPSNSESQWFAICLHQEPSDTTQRLRKPLDDITNTNATAESSAAESESETSVAGDEEWVPDDMDISDDEEDVALLNSNIDKTDWQAHLPPELAHD